MEVSWNGPRAGRHERLSCLWCRGGARQLGVSPGAAARSPAGLSPAPARTSAGSARGRARRVARAEDPSADAAQAQEGHGAPGISRSGFASRTRPGRRARIRVYSHVLREHTAGIRDIFAQAVKAPVSKSVSSPPRLTMTAGATARQAACLSCVRAPECVAADQLARLCTGSGPLTSSASPGPRTG